MNSSDSTQKGSVFTTPSLAAMPAGHETSRDLLKAARPQGDAGTSRSRILIVDDSKELTQTLGYMFEYLGHDVRKAHDGATALALAAAFLPDVILLDISLPAMSGYDACRKMRKIAGLKDTIFIAQTGLDQAEHRERSMAAGFDYHLAKPVDMNTITQILLAIDLRSLSLAESGYGMPFM